MCAWLRVLDAMPYGEPFIGDLDDEWDTDE
jgi:hypothetical protein